MLCDCRNARKKEQSQQKVIITDYLGQNYHQSLVNIVPNYKWALRQCILS